MIDRFDELWIDAQLGETRCGSSGIDRVQRDSWVAVPRLVLAEGASDNALQLHLDGPMLFAFLFSWYAFPEKKQMWMAFGAMSFVSFAMMWLYDFVLMALSPQDMVRTL